MTRRFRLKLILTIAGLFSLQACTLPYVATELERLGAIAIGQAAGSTSENDPEHTGETAFESDFHSDVILFRLEKTSGDVVQAGEAVTLTASAHLENTHDPVDLPEVFWRINGRSPGGNATTTGASNETLTLQTQPAESGMVYVVTAYTTFEDTDISVSQSIRVCACQE